MRLTIVHPCIGRRVGEPYIRSWQMEPLAPAALAGLTPRDVEVKFYDDRMELIPYDEPTDLVAISVETYTAKRAYQIASEYRRRGVPVVMGGFHPTLVPDEVSDYAEATIIGEAEGLWHQVIEDFRSGRLQRFYKQPSRPSLSGLRLDRSIFEGKRYLPIGLVEAGRGCHFRCEFCAIQSYFSSTQTRRPTEEIIAELRTLDKKLIFFVDDNITSNMEQAKEFFRALIPLKIRWVSQASINAAHDEEFLQLLKASGCQGLLIGFETLNPNNLKRMHKGFNTMKGGYEKALANLRRYGIRLYITFILGYDDDNGDTFRETLDFAMRHKFYIVAFNHLTPFPGTPLYERLEREGRLLYDKWWLHPDYRYGMVPFVPQGMTAEMVQERCIEARQSFYSLPSLFRRSLDFQVNSNNFFMWSNFFVINLMMRKEVLQRRDFPLGDEAYTKPLVKAAHSGEAVRLSPLETLTSGIALAG
ncbi:MAG TPA: radical SAM protein [Ardenticatenaceae bacterium]